MTDCYYCYECEKYFTEDEAGIYREDPIGDGRGGYIAYMVCPYCGGDSYEDAYECKMCGEPTLEEACDECKAEFFKDVDEFLEKESKYFKDCEIDLLKDLLDKYLDK